MWWMLLIAIVVLPLVLWLLQRRRGPPNESDLLQTFQFVFGVLLNQGKSGDFFFIVVPSRSSNYDLHEL